MSMQYFRFSSFARFFGQGLARWCCKGIGGISSPQQAAAGFLFCHMERRVVSWAVCCPGLLRLRCKRTAIH